MELADLPSSEDDSHEYKSSSTPQPKLASELGVAASAFWNSGGGLLVVGVDDSGRVDGGIDAFVGRTPLRDWVDRAVAAVVPTAKYTVVTLSDSVIDIAPGRCVLLVAFEESSIPPHMAPDKRYYIRAGAHGDPASAYMVEALIARRGLTQPLLRHVLSRKANSVQLAIVCASTAPALDVRITLPASELFFSDRQTSLHVGVVSQTNPLVIDLRETLLGDEVTPPLPLLVLYRDALGREHSQTFAIDVASPLPLAFTSDDMSRRLARIEDAIQDAGSSIGRELQAQANSVRGLFRR
jgi:Putative DNA-binding domain